ncbi:MAG TPA: chemotaxis protein CheW [Polyangia bacterium]|jgi:purine-binding chemotaxis protein CheW|nr:chemotaxis protein CheW [Polyangia bacterium]
MLSEPHHLCTFTAGPYWFGVAVDSVQEVVRHHAITRIPLSSPMVSGLMNLRGQIVMVIDLRRCLGLPEASADVRPMNVVLRRQEGPISLLVDTIGDVRQVDPDLFELPPDTLREPARALIQGVYKLSNRLLIVLNADRVIATAAAERNMEERTS